MRRLIFLLGALVLAFPVFAQEDDVDTLTIPFLPALPDAGFDLDGTRTGFVVELGRLIADEIGMQVSVLDVQTPEELVEVQQSGKTQMSAGVAKEARLLATNVFSELVATELTRPVMLRERAGEFPDGAITGARIGIIPDGPGSQETNFLAQNIPVIYEGPEAAVMGLLLGTVDALLIPDPVVYSIARRAGADGRLHFGGEPLRRVDRFVALHESHADLLGPVNAAIATLEADGRLDALRARFNITLPPPPPDELVVGVTNFPPYQFVNDAGEADGFAVDVLRDLGSRLGLTLKFKPITRDEWMTGPGPGRFDMLPQISATAARAARMDLALPIEQSENSIFVRVQDVGTVADLADLAGKTVGAQIESQAGNIAAAVLGDDLTTVQDRDVLIRDLLAGDLDAVVFSRKVFLEHLKELDLLDSIAVVDPPFNIVRRAPAFRFGLAPVRDRMNEIIPGYLLSDEYAALQQKYFGEPAVWTQEQFNLLLSSLGLAMVVFVGIVGGVYLRARTRDAALVAVARDELQTIFHAASSGIVALDALGRIVRINNRGRHILGGISDPTPFRWPETMSFLDADTMKPLEASASPLNRALSGHNLQSETHLLRRLQDGEDRRYVRVDNAMIANDESGIHMVLVIDDVSGEERNRQVIERKNRLDALGQLTGGIAHDFNNLLASQLYAVDLARKAVDPAKRDRFLETAAKAIQRGRSLTARLLAFARRQPGLASVRKTSAVFHDFEDLIRPMLEARIEITLSVEEDDLYHFCDQAQLETALMNLVLNARDAILKSGNGNRIDVKARPVRATNSGLDGNQGAGHPEEPEAANTFRYVEISVADNGPGMDEETQARCTDPFFTTKDTNSGTGLGLAMVYGFVRQSDGDLRIYSEEGIGTTVQLTLPRGTRAGVREAAMPEDAVLRGNGQKILVVEDEQLLLVMITEVLEELGYSVVAATSGQEALGLITGGLEFDLLLTDVVMPGKIGGFELAKRMRALHGDKPVIYTSGYTGFTTTEMGEVQAPLLQKPTPPTELAEAISRALGGQDAEN